MKKLVEELQKAHNELLAKKIESRSFSLEDAMEVSASEARMEMLIQIKKEELFWKQVTKENKE